MTFQQAVVQTTDLGASAFRYGLQALGNDSSKVQFASTRSLVGSVALDNALQARYPNDPRWDYGIGLKKSARQSAVWIEVHPASTSEVTAGLNNLGWLKNWLTTRAPALHTLTAVRSYFWVATSGVHIRHGSPQARRLQVAGLSLPRKRVDL